MKRSHKTKKFTKLGLNLRLSFFFFFISFGLRFLLLLWFLLLFEFLCFFLLLLLWLLILQWLWSWLLLLLLWLGLWLFWSLLNLSWIIDFFRLTFLSLLTKPTAPVTLEDKGGMPFLYKKIYKVIKRHYLVRVGAPPPPHWKKRYPLKFQGAP